MIASRELRCGNEYRLITGDVVLVERISGRGRDRAVTLDRIPAGQRERHVNVREFSRLAEEDLGRPGAGSFELEGSCDTK